MDAPGEVERMDQNGRHSHDKRQPRPWSMRVLTLLLAIEGTALILAGILGVDLTAAIQVILTETTIYATMPLVGFLAIVAVIGFLTVRPGAWILAMLVQGLVLFVTLLFYFLYRPSNLIIYAFMLYAILMVIYLNYADVPSFFRMQPMIVEELAEQGES